MTGADQENGAQPQNMNRVAVIGYAGRFPGAPDIGTFWRNLRSGADSSVELSDADLDKAGVSPRTRQNMNFVRRAQVLDGADQFDAEFFGVSPSEAELLDPQQRLFLECAWEAFEFAGYVPAQYPGSVGVFAGAGLSTYLLHNVLPELADDDPVLLYQAKIGNDKDFLPTRLSYKLNLTGPSIAIQTACSTSLVAVHLACQSLLDGECDAALAGASSIMIPQGAGYIYQPGMILSPDGRCRPFDVAAQGTIRGDGVAAVLLKRLGDALRDRDTVHGVILGSAVNNDGSQKLGFTAPSSAGQRDAIVQAHVMAGVPASSISYVEAHGTGTELGDPIEVEALTDAFRASADERAFCALGSVKSNVGHLDTVAGLTGLIKVLLMLRHGEIPPTVHFRSANPKLALADTPFYVNSELRRWQARGPTRRAGVNSLGIGGTNAHVVVEEPPAPVATASCRESQVLVLSARSRDALDAATERLAVHLRATPDADLADVAFTLRAGRTAHPYRRVVLARSVAEAAGHLAARQPQRVLTGMAAPTARPVAFLFPGQGAQRPLMAESLRKAEPAFRSAFDECAAIFAEGFGHDLTVLVYDATEARLLDQTEFAQPALFAVEYACARLWESWGVRPAAMLGHSLGEYVAAQLAGVFSLEDAIHLVARRGRLMQSTPRAAMLAVELSEAEALARLPDGVDLAAVNAERRCVVAGTADLIDGLREQLASERVPCRPVATSHAFHSAMMEPILAEFAEHVRRANPQPPGIPFVSNVTGGWITAAQATSPDYWAGHLRSPVRFHDGLATLLATGETAVVECGPGQTLASLARRHPKGAAAVARSTARADADQDDHTVALTGLASLWTVGVPVSLGDAAGHYQCRRVQLPTYPFERRRYWLAPAHPAGQPADPLEPSPADWLYVPTWRRSAPPTAAAAHGRPQRWLLIAGQQDLAGALAARLRELGHQALLAPDGESGSAGDRNPVGLMSADEPFDQVVHLGGVTGQAEPAQDVHPVFADILSVVRALASRGSPPVTLSVVTDQMFAIESADQVALGKAPLLGLAAVLPQEAQQVRCRVIDLPVVPAGADGARLAPQLAAELTSAAADATVAFRGRYRLLPGFDRVPPGDAGLAPVLRRRGVYMITGGLGRVGMCLAEGLARTWQARLVLTTRSAFPPRPEWDHLRSADDQTGRAIRRLLALQADGAEVVVIQADVAAETQMRSAVTQAATRFGALDGVVHAAGLAGVSALIPVSRLTAEACAQHFRAKVTGTQVLRRVLAASPPGFVVLVGSNATVLGGPGLAAYAAASAYLNAAAEEWTGTGPTRWLAINWDRLSLEGQQPAAHVTKQRDRFALRGEQAIESFERALALLPGGQVVVSRAPIEARVASWRASLALTRAPAAPVPDRAGGDGLEQVIADVWKELLGISEIGMDDNFFDLGGDSLIGLRVVAELERRLDSSVPPVQLYEGPTVRALAELLRGQSGDGKLAQEAELASRRRQVMRREIRRREEKVSRE